MRFQTIELPGDRPCDCSLCWIIGVFAAVWVFQSGGRTQRVKSWAGDPSEWTQTNCHVLATGQAYHGDLEGAKDVPISQCPGISWCAAENDVCHCDGTVTYTTATHAGYTMGAGNGTSVDSNNEVMCRFMPRGPFASDPAPGEKKACFCTPRHITHLLGGRQTHRESCTAIEKASFQHPRRLKGNQEEQEAEVEMLEIPGRNSGGWFSSDIYQPWALVEVTTPNQEDPVLRCGYAYGLPFASRYPAQPAWYDWYGPLTQQYPGAGAFNSPLLSSTWTGTRACWVRNNASNYCSVAMEPPHHLVTEENTVHANHFWWLVACLLCAGGGACANVFIERNTRTQLPVFGREPTEEQTSGDRSVPLLTSGEEL